jgi:hypothetical protein
MLQPAVPAVARRVLRGPALAAGLWSAGAVAVFWGNFRLSQTNATNSDGASQALQAWDLLHGNILLHGWGMTQVSFYTTEIPEYALVEIARGLTADVVHIAAAVTYTLAMLLAALLAMGPRAACPGGERVARGLIAAGIMLAPQLDAGTYTLLNLPDHFGTSVPVLLAWLILDRGGSRRWVPAAVTAILAWAAIGDATVLVIGVAPLVFTCAYRALRGRRADRPEATLAVGTLIAAGIGLGAPHLIASLGGYTSEPVATILAPVSQVLGHNARTAGTGLLLLGGADFLGVPPGPRAWIAMLHLAGVALGGCAILLAAWRFPRARAGGGDLVTQVLLAGIVINLVTYVAGVHAAELLNTREIAPVLPFAATLAGRLLARPALDCTVPGLSRRAIRPVVPLLLVVLGAYLAGLGYALRQPVMPPQNARLTSWLRAHHLESGLSGFWQAGVVTLTSGGHVMIAPVQRHARLQAETRLAKTDWYDPGRSYANFVVTYYPGYAGREPFTGFTGEVAFPGQAATIATFGPPARTYRLGPYMIFVWDKNLLSELRPAAR